MKLLYCRCVDDSTVDENMNARVLKRLGTDFRFEITLYRHKYDGWAYKTEFKRVKNYCFVQYSPYFIYPLSKLFLSLILNNAGRFNKVARNKALTKFKKNFNTTLFYFKKFVKNRTITANMPPYKF